MDYFEEGVYTFYPPRRAGSIVLGALTVVLILLNLWNLVQLTLTPVGPAFARGLLIALLASAPLPWLAYQFWALQRSSYTLERDGIRLVWGLRAVDIPMNEVLWVRGMGRARIPLPPFWLRLPGAVLARGFSIPAIAGDIPVEFIASRTSDLVFIATRERVYAISPAESDAFLQTFRGLAQLGSLNPLPARSVLPVFWLGGIWQAGPIRILFISSILLNLALVVWVSLESAARDSIHLGFTPQGMPADPIPSQGLWLLPFLNFIISLGDWLFGLYLYRSEKNRPLAYLLWGSGVFCSFLFLGALYYLLQSG